MTTTTLINNLRPDTFWKSKKTGHLVTIETLTTIEGARSSRSATFVVFNLGTHQPGYRAGYNCVDAAGRITEIYDPTLNRQENLAAFCRDFEPIEK